jgi:hypothetical protein
VLAWYGPYDAHEANSIAKTSLTKAFIEAFLGAPPRHRMEAAPGTQARIFGRRDWGGEILSKDVLSVLKRLFIKLLT